MRAAAVGVDAVREPDVGAVVGRDDRAGVVLQIYRRRARQLWSLFEYLVEVVSVTLQRWRLGPIWRVISRAARLDGRLVRVHVTSFVIIGANPAPRGRSTSAQRAWIAYHSV